MYALNVMNVKKVFVTRTVFEGVTFGLEQGEKVGIVGPNGVGKTTLLRILTGEAQADGGTVQWDKSLSREQIGLLTQQADVQEGETVEAFVRRAKPELLAVEAEMQRIEVMMADPSQDLDSLISRYGELQERFESLGGYSYTAEVEQVLQEVGLPREVWHTPFTAVSGGQKTRAQLARLLLMQPQVLLLDEPTNHLDSETMDWLEQKIRRFPGLVVTVSHDRYFLDRVATRILELRPAGIGSYPGNYTAYVEQKDLERRTQQAAHNRQQAELSHLKDMIHNYRNWFRAVGNHDRANKHIKRLRSTEKRMEKLQEQRVAQPKESSGLHVQFQAEGRMGNRIFSAEKVAVRFGDRELYRDVTFAVEKGHCLALVGPNGAGKSTLLKVLLGELAPSEGTVKTAPSVQAGYFGQEVDRLNPEHTILEEVLSTNNLQPAEARTILACFLFRGEDVFKRISALSQGEKCRVAFVKLYFSGANVLVLDEPTNYLDIPARERIEDALLNFPGTVLLVSHDRYMVQRLATQLLLFEKGQVSHFSGSWQDWVEHTNLRRFTPEERQREEQRMIFQMELSKLADQLADPHVRPERAAGIRAQMNEVQKQLRSLSS